MWPIRRRQHRVATTAMPGRCRHRLRSRANLRPPSRSACVIDRLLKNQNSLENCNNLRSSSPHLVVGRRLENRAAILRSEIHGHGSHGCSDRWCSVRAFDDSTARRSAAATSRGPRPDGSRAGWRLRQSHHLAPALSSTGARFCEKRRARSASARASPPLAPSNCRSSTASCAALPGQTADACRRRPPRVDVPLGLVEHACGRHRVPV